MADKDFSLLLHIFCLRRATVCAMYDPLYRRLFAFARMVADLLRSVGEPDWIDDIDFATLEELRWCAGPTDRPFFGGGHLPFPAPYR